MDISFTYFPEFKGLEKHVDLLEFGGFPLNEKDLRLKDRWSFHFRRDLNGERLHLLLPEKVKESVDYFNRTGLKPEIVSFHLGYAAEKIGKVTGYDNHNYAISEVYSKKEILKTFTESFRIITESITDIPIAIENMDYNKGGAYEHICEPEFIKDILARNPNIYLLLDLTHAQISAHKLLKQHEGSERAEKYINSLPLDRIIEIHLSSPDEKYGDMHRPATDREIYILRSIMEKIPNLKLINLEYRSDNPDAARMIPETVNILRKIFNQDQA
ncbi:MAG: DUF692 family protein [archaeon]|nr:DUF692 family protein [archaeon]